MNALADARLYAIADTGYMEPGRLTFILEQLAEGGADVIQLRAKNLPLTQVQELALKAQMVLRGSGIPLIINDFPQVCRESGADGVHLGQDDGSIADARAQAGFGAVLVGRSTHRFDQAQAAEAEGADYIGFGPLFSTPTKPGRSPIGLEDIGRVHQLVSLPIFCIGGIKRDNLPEVIAAGARRVVIVSGILQAPDIAGYCRDVKALLTSPAAFQ